MAYGERWPAVVRYSLLAVIILAVGAANHSIDKPFLLYFPVIIIAALFFGPGSGYLATILASLFVTVYLPPLGSMEVAETSDRIGLALFFVSGIAMTAMAEALRHRVVALNAEKERIVVLAAERQLLLDELAHRTRNDLGNVVTLLKLQSASAEEGCRAGFKAAAERVQSIARIHHHLEVKGEHVAVDSREYLEDLCGELQMSRFSARPVRLECRAESHPIAIEKAVPLGLMVNELVTNASKHAFPDGRTGHIKVSFKRMDGHYRLAVSDDGVGLNSTAVASGGLGTKLLGLFAGQLGSHFEIKPGTLGTEAYIEIPVRTAPKSV